MADQLISIDISDTPDLLRLAEEVHRSHESRVLRRDGEDLALVVPLPRPTRRRRGRTLSQADYEAFRSAAGGWKDIDTDQLVENIYESRKISERPPVDL
jgi:class 3 adenylate cyclase